MEKKLFEASEVKWDVNSPPDSPFILDPAMTEGPAIPTAYVRRMEEAQRLFSLHEAQQAAYGDAYKRGALTVGVQCAWLGVGGWLTARGYRCADPVHSFVSGLTSNRFLCRVFTPLALLGITIASVTAAQLPSDVRMLRDARNAWCVEDANKAMALKMRAMAFHEGKMEVERLKAEENCTSERLMTEAVESSK